MLPHTHRICFYLFFLRFCSPTCVWVSVCLYKVFFCQSQNWRLRWGSMGAHKKYESHTLTHNFDTILMKFSWNTQQWQPNTTLAHWSMRIDVCVCLVYFSSQNVIIEPTQLRSLIIFWTITLSPSCLLYHYRRSLQLIGCCSLSGVYCLYHDHLSIRFYFSIFVCFYSFRIVSFTVSNSDMSGKCFNHRSFLAVSHCNFMFSNCDTAITRTQTLSLSSFLSCIWNCWTMLTLLLFCSFEILICFSPLCLQTHRTIDLFHLLN